MGDLVERLRLTADEHNAPSEYDPAPCGYLLEQAADEITRLRARVAELEAFAREVVGV